MGGQGILAARHGGRLAVLRHDLRDEETFVGIAGDDAGLLVIALLEQVGVIGQQIIALGLGRLVAALALLLKDRADVADVADLVGEFRLFLFVPVESGPAERQQDDGE